MCGAHDRRTACTLEVHEAEVPLTARGIQARGRLVEQQQVSTATCRLREVHALALTARQRTEWPVGQRLHAHRDHGVIHIPLVLPAQPTQQATHGPPPHAHHVLRPDGQQKSLLVRLREIRHARAATPGHTVKHLQTPINCGNESGNAPQKSALARSVGAHHRKPLPRGESQGDTGHHGVAAVPDGEVVRADGGGGHACSGCGRRDGRNPCTTSATKKMPTATSTTVAPAARS